MPRKKKIKIVGSETFTNEKGKRKKTISYRTPTKKRAKGGKILNLNKTVFVTDLTKIKIGSPVRKFDGKRYNQSGSYRTKSSAIKAKKFAKENSGLARIVKTPKGYVVYTNYSKTRGKLKKRKK